MIRPILLFAGPLLLTMGLASPAEAASFDCARAGAPDEIAVCRNPALSALDSEMGGLWYAYSRFPFAMGSSGARRDDAQAFLARRRACAGNVTCLTRAYTDRIATLRDGVARAIAQLTQEAGGGPI